MKEHRVGIIMNGVTGRMGANQHLLRSVAAIIKQGGVRFGTGDTIMPDPVLVGRNPDKLKELAALSGVTRTSTDLAAVLKDPAYTVYFDAQSTVRRAVDLGAAIDAGKHVYCEKPVASDLPTSLGLYRKCVRAGVKNGVVQDKLWLPGLVKLARLKRQGFFGRILSVKGDFGYWVFEGDTVAGQRPSWNYRKEDGGGIIIDMLCHWRYVLDQLFGAVEAVCCLGVTHLPQRWDEQGRPYVATADDAAYALFRLKDGIIAQFNSSWCTRVRRDDLLTLQVDGTHGSAVAGLRECWMQPAGATPRLTWNPDLPQSVKFFDTWQRVPDVEDLDNAFKAQWELFLRHVVLDEPFPWSLLEGAKGVQLAEKSLESSARQAWVELPSLTN